MTGHDKRQEQILIEGLKRVESCLRTAAGGPPGTAVLVSCDDVAGMLGAVERAINIVCVVEPRGIVGIAASVRAFYGKSPSTPHDIIVDLDGGLVQDVHALPPGVRVVVRDYDIEGADDDELHTDDSGAKYYHSVYARTCVVCNGEHPPCTMCGGITRCDMEEPSEAFTLCDSCDAEMKGGAV